MNLEKIVNSAMLAFLALTSTQTAFAADENDPAPQEKCYNIVKAGMNDCHTATSKCAGSATKDAQPDAFIFLPKGICTKLVGGQLAPPSTMPKS